MINVKDRTQRIYDSLDIAIEDVYGAYARRMSRLFVLALEEWQATFAPNWRVKFEEGMGSASVTVSRPGTNKVWRVYWMGSNPDYESEHRAINTPHMIHELNFICAQFTGEALYQRFPPFTLDPIKITHNA
jgi:hypothetical protein